MSVHSLAPHRRIALAATAVLLGATVALAPLPAAELAWGAPATSKQAEAQAALSSHNAPQSTLAEAEANYEEAMGEQIAAKGRMDEAQGRIDEATGQITELQGHLGTRARSMYVSGSTSFLDLLLGASTFQAFANNWDILNTLNQNDADMVSQTKALRAEVEQQRAEYAEQEKVAAAKAEEMAAIVKDSEALVSQQQAVYDNLSAEAAALVEQERASQESQRQQAAIDGIAAGNGGSGSGSGSNGGSSGGSSWEPPYVPSTGNAVVNRAYQCVGAPYAYGATGPSSFDCSGLVGYALTGSYGRTVTSGSFAGGPFVSNPQPGDVCWESGHVGIYVGGGQMIHAPEPGRTVTVAAVHPGMRYVRR